MLRPIKLTHEGKESSFACVHWEFFPPTAGLIAQYEKITLDEYWQTGRLDVKDYQPAKVWEKICNKFKMDASCIDCGQIRRLEIKNMLPCLVTLDGTHSVPQVDIPTLELALGKTPIIIPDSTTREKRAKK